MNVKDEFSHVSPDGCDLLRMRMRTQCDKHDIDYKLALKQQERQCFSPFIMSPDMKKNSS